jgi:hypothetical protein
LACIAKLNRRAQTVPTASRQITYFFSLYLNDKETRKREKHVPKTLVLVGLSENILVASFKNKASKHVNKESC